MPESENKSFSQDNLKKSKGKGQDLPWWVELLFVQIGLPETLLRNWLKTKLIVSDHVNNQKKKYAISIFTLGIIAFISPLVQESIYKNSCVRETKILLKNNIKSQGNKNIKSYSVSVNHCNGGDSFSSTLDD